MLSEAAAIPEFKGLKHAVLIRGLYSEVYTKVPTTVIIHRYFGFKLLLQNTLVFP